LGYYFNGRGAIGSIWWKEQSGFSCRDFDKKKFFVWFFQKELEKVGEIKTGFYYALKANVPLIPVAFDFGKKKSI
jgi:hypothetical protein